MIHVVSVTSKKCPENRWILEMDGGRKREPDSGLNRRELHLPPWECIRSRGERIHGDWGRWESRIGADIVFLNSHRSSMNSVGEAVHVARIRRIHQRRQRQRRYLVSGWIHPHQPGYVDFFPSRGLLKHPANHPIILHGKRENSYFTRTKSWGKDGHFFPLQIVRRKGGNKWIIIYFYLTLAPLSWESFPSTLYSWQTQFDFSPFGALPR